MSILSIRACRWRTTADLPRRLDAGHCGPFAGCRSFDIIGRVLDGGALVWIVPDESSEQARAGCAPRISDAGRTRFAAALPHFQYSQPAGRAGQPGC